MTELQLSFQFYVIPSPQTNSDRIMRWLAKHIRSLLGQIKAREKLPVVWYYSFFKRSLLDSSAVLLQGNWTYFFLILGATVTRLPPKKKSYDWSEQEVKARVSFLYSLYSCFKLARAVSCFTQWNYITVAEIKTNLDLRDIFTLSL